MAELQAKAQQIDTLVTANLEKQKLQPNAPVSDEVFVRRIYLDVVGRIPTLKETTDFLADKSADKRLLGIAVAMREDLNLLPSVVPLLSDSEAPVRRAAMLALGPIHEGAAGAERPLVHNQDLIRWLHDPDPEVRHLCEMSLRSRGLSERDVHLGRMLTDPDPMARLQLLLELPDQDDLSNMTKWLQKLSEDPDSAVRAAAVRVAAERQIDFADRLEQMTRTDPYGTARQIAEHYRKRYR